MSLNENKKFAEKKSTDFEKKRRLFYQLSDEFCPACGGNAENNPTKYCVVCGKFLAEDYQPLDFFKSSYSLHGKNLVYGKIIAQEAENLFEQNKNSVAETAWACVVYSMIPYIGVLFLPLAFILSGVGFYVSRKNPALGGEKNSKISFVWAFIVLAIQIFLWWLLYFIPKIAIPQI